MFIKICGTTNRRDAELAVSLGADALGFIFAPSKRRVSAAEVAAISPHLPPGVERVGVFTEGKAEEIAATAQEAGLTAVQLHRDYDPTLVRDLAASVPGLRIWQVIFYEINREGDRSFEENFVMQLAKSFADRHIAVTLLDASRSGASGGLGVPFPWARASVLVKQARTLAGTQRIGAALAIAGGLQAENVAEAVRTLEPFGIDCVSGVEASPGTKDPTRLRLFMAAARPTAEPLS